MRTTTYQIVVGLLACALVSVSSVHAQTPLEILFPPPPNSAATEISRGTRTLAEHADTFTDPAEATSLLTAWGWQDNAFQYWEATGSSGADAATPSLYISLTRFADEDGAAAALPYIVADLSAGEGHRDVPVAASIGDDSYALISPIDGGTDYTLYVRSDALIIRVSTLLAYGAPMADPEQVAAQIIASQYAPPVPTRALRSLLADLLDTLPADLPSCLTVVGEEAYDFPGIVARFPMYPDARAELQNLGWEAGSFRQFSCGAQPVDGLNWVDMSVHEFRSPDGAANAVPYFAQARTEGTQLSAAEALPLGDQSAAISGPSELGFE